MSLQGHPALERTNSTSIDRPYTINEPTPAPSPSPPPPFSPSSTAQTPPALRYEVYLTINDLFRSRASSPQLVAVCQTLIEAIDVARNTLFELQPIEFANAEAFEDGEADELVYYCEAELTKREEGRVEVFLKAKDERFCWVLSKAGKVMAANLSEAGMRRRMAEMLAEGGQEDLLKVEKVLLDD